MVGYTGGLSARYRVPVKFSNRQSSHDMTMNNDREMRAVSLNKDQEAHPLDGLLIISKLSDTAS